MAIGDRLVSETAGVATLVLFTVIVTASVGIGVLFVDQEDDGPTADFAFEYESDASRLTVTHSSGQAFAAGDLVFEGPNNNVTWAEAASWNDSREVSQGDIVRLSRKNDYDDRVRSEDVINVVYVPGNGNRTQLDTWNGTESGAF